MQNAPAENLGEQDLRLDAGPRKFNVLSSVGLVSLIIGLAFGLAEEDGLARFLHSYLVSYCFVLSISLGAFFFVAVLHATRAGWGTVLRRIAELLAANVLLLCVLFLPILVPALAGHSVLYEWINPQLLQEGGEQFNELIAHKHSYLNVPFFVIRALTYFAIWGLMTRYFLARSVEQDASGDPALTLKMERWSGPALIVFGITLTFAAFDWLMSLEPEWFSTIFGLYFFAGSVVSSLSAIIVAAVYLQSTGKLGSAITPEHYHDLGKFLLAFVVFWGYMGFSQYMLMWYANIPEETWWYLKRQSGGWLYVTVGLLAGHLLIPFFGLLSREVKRRRQVLVCWAIWLLVFHWVDMYWLVMPSLGQARPPFGLLDVAIGLGVVGLYLAGLVRVAGDKSLLPRQDPRLGESLAFENF